MTLFPVVRDQKIPPEEIHTHSKKPLDPGTAIWKGTSTQAIPRSLAHGQKAESIPHTEMHAAFLAAFSRQALRAAGSQQWACSIRAPWRVTLTNGCWGCFSSRGTTAQHLWMQVWHCSKVSCTAIKNSSFISTHAGYFIIHACFLVLKFIFTKNIYKGLSQVLCGYIVQHILQYWKKQQNNATNYHILSACSSKYVALLQGRKATTQMEKWGYWDCHSSELATYRFFFLQWITSHSNWLTQRKTENKDLQTLLQEEMPAHK